MPNTFLHVLIVIHAVTSILMAWPYYALVITGEKGKLGPPRDRTDDYQENIIRQQSYRCLVFQITLLVTGTLIILMKTDGGLLLTLQTNLRMLAKLLLVVLLVCMNIYMVFYLQTRIDKNMAADPSDKEAARLVAKYRYRRRWMAATCLWYVLMAVILGVQVWTSFGRNFILVSALIAALFVWRTYRNLSPWGFI